MAAAVAEGVRVGILDDHPVFRTGLRRVLELDGRFRCVWEASDTPSARACLLEHAVDVVVVDIALGRGSGLDFLHALRAERPDTRSLVLTVSDERLYGDRARKAGASAFMHKDRPGAEICAALFAVARGGAALAADGPRTASGGSLDLLSDREIEVFRLLGDAMTVPLIASALGLSTKTVESHRANVARKLGLRGTAALVRAAVTAFHPVHGR